MLKSTIALEKGEEENEGGWSENEHPKYEEVAILGHGAYGTVYKARDIQENGRFVAIKKIRVQLNNEEGMPMSTIREISMLKQLEVFEHPNVVRLFDVCHGKRSATEMSLMLVFEHVDQDLAQYLEKCPSPGLGPDRIRNLMHQIVCGVDFLHSNRIVHRDLKPQNVLVTSCGQIKLADFGLARIYAFSMALTTVVVTLWYRAPEVLLQGHYQTPVDIWSCGCIFAELFTRRALFCGQSDIDQLYKIFDITGLAAEDQWPDSVSLPWSSFRNTAKQPWEKYIPDLDYHAKDLLEKMLKFNQHDRITAQDAMKHAYFNDENADTSNNMSMSSNEYSANGLFDETTTTEEEDDEDDYEDDYETEEDHTEDDEVKDKKDKE